MNNINNINIFYIINNINNYNNKYNIIIILQQNLFGIVVKVALVT